MIELMSRIEYYHAKRKFYLAENKPLGETKNKSRRSLREILRLSFLRFFSLLSFGNQNFKERRVKNERKS